MPKGASDYSDTTAELIDNEIKRIIDEGYKKALGILKTRKNVLEKAVVVLLEKEKIDGEELKAIIDKHEKNTEEKSG